MINNRTAGSLGGLALVLIGVAIGIGADRLWLSHHGGPTPHESHEMALQHMQQMFDLDDDQLEQIDAIFRRHQGVVVASWAQVEPSLRTAVESVATAPRLAPIRQRPVGFVRSGKRFSSSGTSSSTRNFACGS